MASRRAKGEGVTRNKAILRWLNAEEEAEQARRRAAQMQGKARRAALPKRLRPATSLDIKEGEIIWYKHFDTGHGWMMVSEVHHPDDAFKAYTAHDGCRYGLDDAWVEL